MTAEGAGQHTGGTPSPWVVRHLAAAPRGGATLDVACGAGRHTRLAMARGHTVVAVDRDVAGIADLVSDPRLAVVAADLEGGSAPPFAGRTFAAVIVTNYLWRPLLPAIVAAVASDGVLIYETFARGQEAFGRPRNPDFLLQPGELLEAVRGRLIPVAYEHGLVDDPPRMVQRIAAVGPGHTVLQAGALK